MIFDSKSKTPEEQSKLLANPKPLPKRWKQIFKQWKDTHTPLLQDEEYVKSSDFFRTIC